MSTISNNKTYLDRFPAAAGIVAVCITTSIIAGSYFPVSEDSGFEAAFIFQFLIKAGILLGLGIMLREMKAGLTAIGLALVCNGITFFITKDWKTASSSLYLLLYLSSVLLGLLPFLLLVIMAGGGWKRNKFALTIIALLAIQLSFENQSVVMATQYLFNSSSESSVRVIVMRILVAFISGSASMIAVCELMNYVKADDFIKKIRLLNLANNPSIFGNTLAFWVLKSALIIHCLSLGIYARNLPTYLHSSYMAEFRVYFSTFTICSMLGITVFILGICWYLRKQVFEHLLMYNLSSRTWIWLFSLPFAGFIAWLISLATGTKQESVRERTSTLGDYASASTRTVLFITGICYLLLLINNISRNNVSGGLLILVSAGMYFFYATQRAGFYILVWLQALFTLYAFFRIITAKDAGFFSAEISNTAGLLAVGALGFAYTLLQLPVFHPTMFEYIPAVDETEETEEGKDLFADYRLN